MTHRLCTATATVAVAALALAASAAAATESWTTPQDLGPVAGDFGANTALASNDRGDAVLVVSAPTGIYVARARAHEDFAALRRIASSGSDPSVAVDARGVALVAFSYFDGTHVADDLRDDDCCTGVKVAVWQPGHRPTPPRAVRPRGVATQLGAVAATRGQRGVLIAGEEFSANADDPVRLVPVRIDGRLGARRKVAGAGWSPLTLQWAGGRAIAGLVRISERRGTEFATARQRRSGGFTAPRRFVRLSGQLSVSYFDASLSELEMSPDGHGGQIAAYQRFKRPHLRLAITRKPLDGPPRSSFVQRGPNRALKVTPPARARDGWIAVAWSRRGGAPSFAETAYVTTRSPGGRLTTTGLPGPVGSFDTLAVGVAPGGGGAVGAGGYVPRMGSQTAVAALAGGRPQPAIGFAVGPDQAAATRVAITANAQDPARAVIEFRGSAVATRLAPAAG